VESLSDAYASLSAPPPTSDPAADCGADGDSEKHGAQQESQAQPRAVILCKLKKTEDPERVFPAEKKKGRGQTERYEIAWPELQELENRFGNSFQHDRSKK
jgi:hypothetical protein